MKQDVRDYVDKLALDTIAAIECGPLFRHLYTLLYGALDVAEKAQAVTAYETDCITNALLSSRARYILKGGEDIDI